jgi:carbon storage regulator
MRQEEPCPRKKERPMIVFSRKPNESILINENVVVTVLSIHGETVQLGIEAPVEMPVRRGEVHERMQSRDVLTTIG